MDDIRKLALEYGFRSVRIPMSGSDIPSRMVVEHSKIYEAYLREPVPEDDSDAAANVASDYDRQMLGLDIPPGFSAAVAARYATSPVEPKPPSAFDLWPLTPEPDHES